jgi:cell wall-associated NlpC family hydrolase
MIRRCLAACVIALAASSAFASNTVPAIPDAVGSFRPVQQTKTDDALPKVEASQKSATERLTESVASFATKAEGIIDTSLSLIGIRYKWGGNTAAEGFDCSGFVKRVYESSIGFSLPRTALEMSRRGETIKKDDLKPGDLVFFNTVKRTISHVGIYLGANRFIHAPRTGASIRVDSMESKYWETRYAGGRRVTNLGDLDPIASIQMQSSRDIIVAK